MKKCFLIFFVFLFLIISDSTAQCNGFNFLCNRKYNEVAFLTTHNAFNNDAEGFLLPNQHNTITQQLNEGVRALMIDVYDVSGVPTVYHGFPYLGSKPLGSNLNEIKSFLVNNPNEIVTLILECHTTSSAIENALNDAELFPYLFAKDSIAPWPSLQEMIDAGERLVVFSEEDNAIAGQDWYHYIWDHAVETNFSISDSGQFSCDYNRGDSLNDLFIVNHFITNVVTGTGMASQAAIVNANPYLTNRLVGCMSEKFKMANFIAVDFYELGNTLDAVNFINSLNWSVIQPLLPVRREIKIGPNPSGNFIYIDIGDADNYPGSHLKIINLLGQEIYSAEIKQQQFVISLSGLCSSGVYFVNISNHQFNNMFLQKIIVE